MIAITAIKKIDKLGRVVIPVDFRKSLNIKSRDEVEIFVESDTIIIKKNITKCIFCISSNDLKIYKGKNICAECRDVTKTF